MARNSQPYDLSSWSQGCPTLNRATGSMGRTSDFPVTGQFDVGGSVRQADAIVFIVVRLPGRSIRERWQQQN